MLTLTSIFVAGLFVAAPAPTPIDEQVESSSDADSRARVGETNIYAFEGDDLEGRVLTAEGTKIRGHRPGKLGSLIKFRTSFFDQLYTQTNDI